MARKVILTDDYADDDTTLATGTIPFSFDGKNYEIDLGDVNAAKFRGQWGPWIAKARPVGGLKRKAIVTATTPPSPVASGLNAEQLAARRTWARANGFEVSDKGRVKQEILEAFDKAHESEVA
jgi:hypothetical protein